METMKVIGAQHNIPLFLPQTAAVAIFATHITAFGFVGARNLL
jgi:hypothetical protein